MSLRKFIFSRTFGVHLLRAFALIAILLILTMIFLRIYTNHGQSKPVPSFLGLSKDEAFRKAGSYNFRIEISDSVHVEKAKPGTVVDQVPEPNMKVKENRTIFITLNAVNPELVAVPKLTDISFRQALVLLENNGFVSGNISYSASEFKELVISAKYEGREIVAGERLAKGSPIDLIVGNGSGSDIMKTDSLENTFF